MGKKNYTKRRRSSRKRNNYRRKKSLTKRGGSSSFSDTPMSWEERLNREREHPLSDPLNRRTDLNNRVSPLMQQLNPAKLIVGSNNDRHQIRERIRGRDCLCGLELKRVMDKKDKGWSDMISEIRKRNEYLERENKILRRKYIQMIVGEVERMGRSGIGFPEPELGPLEFEPHSISGSKRGLLNKGECLNK